MPLIAHLLMQAILSGNPGPRFHGEPTKLREVLATDNITDLVFAHVWTIPDVAIVVWKFPLPGQRREDSTSDRPVWRPLWLAGKYLTIKPIDRGEFERSTILLIAFAGESGKCAINRISGATAMRLARDQDRTVIEIDCAEVSRHLQEIGVVEARRQEIMSHLLATDPAKP